MDRRDLDSEMFLKQSACKPHLLRGSVRARLGWRREGRRLRGRTRPSEAPSPAQCPPLQKGGEPCTHHPAGGGMVSPALPTGPLGESSEGSLVSTWKRQACGVRTDNETLESLTLGQMLTKAACESYQYAREDKAVSPARPPWTP